MRIRPHDVPTGWMRSPPTGPTGLDAACRCANGNITPLPRWGQDATFLLARPWSRSQAAVRRGAVSLGETTAGWNSPHQSSAATAGHRAGVPPVVPAEAAGWGA